MDTKTTAEKEKQTIKANQQIKVFKYMTLHMRRINYKK